MNHLQAWKKLLIGTACFAVIAAGSTAAASPSTFAATTSATASASSTAAQKADKLIAKAKSLQGKVRYKYGVNSPSTYTFDCSAFTKYIFASQGVTLKWGSSAQSKQGTYVSKNNLRKGDLVFFSVGTPGKINHVGIYIGSGKFIHNTIGGSVNGVIISDLNSGNYPKRYITARRVL
ncbi:C40 family peptidase [Cohnella faecalis]|uniref:NlpC/P60 family protein n=1 Tax=Cohnella faecalis TaxID=2315694 RepID=A0A398CJ55_9BACL|nr:C40 family peptidase [Cohnella faecalis]RIE02142.1 NlpC/P60 family protein [Cohnella faecalis]